MRYKLPIIIPNAETAAAQIAKSNYGAMAYLASREVNRMRGQMAPLSAL